LFHTIEAWCWAALFLYLGEFSELRQALYFSVVTSTTLGYGDIILSERWQILGTFEVMGGLILFGTSTAFLLELMRRLFKEPSNTDKTIN
jgi:voltage-gated potassium channel Kch